MADGTTPRNPDGGIRDAGGPRDAGGSLPGGVAEMPDANQPANQAVQPCALQSNQLKSIYIDIGWTFTAGAPAGEYTLVLAGQTFTGPLNGGQIRIDNRLNSLCGDGSLEIRVTNGPVFRSDVTLDLPAVHLPAGLHRRLTNLGFYAGTEAVFDQRASWAVRAFKRARINSFSRNATEPETNDITANFLQSVQAAYGVHPQDLIFPVAQVPVTSVFAPCGQFGSRVYRRSSFNTAGAVNDRDADGAGDNGVWEGVPANGLTEPICGTFRLFLRAFDPGLGEPAIPNRVNVPQPIRMAQFVLWELGYWLVGGRGGWTAAGTQTRVAFTPDGIFGRNGQWATREFQCYAKMDNAAREDVASLENRYLSRLVAESPQPVVGAARYPDAGRVSGALNAATRQALQAWAEERLRCPVVIYASTDNHNPVANGSAFAQIVKENLWFHDDHANTAPRMYASDWSGFYAIPAGYGGTVASGGGTIPRPTVVGEYTSTMFGGPVSLPPRHTWSSAHTEVAPGPMLGTGGLDGAGLTAAQLSTFKVVRTAAHFECLGFFDVLNAYDDVCISFGPCHWTLARTGGTGAPDEAREMPAFLAYFQSRDGGAYERTFGRFGLYPTAAWPLNMAAQSGTYSTRIEIQTETGMQTLCGASGTDAYRREENTYARTWHSYYRFLMACRTSEPLRQAMWGFSRVRIRDIRDKTFTISGAVRRVGDYATSEKAVAMLLRWHIYRPAHLFRTPTPGNPNHLLNIMTAVIAAHPAANQARENAMIAEIDRVGSPLTSNALAQIRAWVNVPQTGTRAYYNLNLINPTLNGTLNSLDFEAP